MSRWTTVFALIGVLGLTLMMVYPLVGAEVTPDGILREAFFLIPLGYVCIAWALSDRPSLLPTIFSHWRATPDGPGITATAACRGQLTR